MSEAIHTWETRLYGIDLAEHAARRPGSDGDRTMPKRAEIAPGPVAVGRANHGRWIADCPFGCGGAEYVDDNRPTFFCCECRNRDVGHVLVPLVMPDTQTRAQIEQLLLARPDVATRNWYSRESVADLAAENVEHVIS